MRLAGIDFTCAPSRRKPITVATGRLVGERLHLDGVAELLTLPAFDDWLREPGPWLGAFDFPFGLPRAFVEANGLGRSCAEVSAAVHARCPTRMAWRDFIDAWGNTQPAGHRLLHRHTDRASAAGSTSPLQTRYVPVGFMYYEGVSRLIQCGVSMSGLYAGDAGRIALEGYPRRTARRIVGRRSYKNGDDDDRRDARATIVAALAVGTACPGVRLVAPKALCATLIEEAGGDRLDAVLCLVQAALAVRQPHFGLPATVDGVEGWICAD